MAALQVPRGDVVGDGVAEHVLIGPVLGDIAAGLADHHRQLDLIVQELGQALVQPHRRAGGIDGGGGLGEDLGEFRQLGRLAGRPGALGHVLDVVAADAEDVLAGARDGGQELHRRGREMDVLVPGQFTRRLQARFARLDQLLDGVHGRGQVGDPAPAQPQPRQLLAVAREGDELHGRLPPLRRQP